MKYLLSVQRHMHSEHFHVIRMTSNAILLESLNHSESHKICEWESAAPFFCLFAVAVVVQSYLIYPLYKRY